MGKAQKLKAERAAARLAMTERAPLIVLKRAVMVVGNAFGTTADCANAAAFLKLTADGLGYELTPRSVSLLVTQPSMDNITFMGPRAAALVDEKDFDRVEDRQTHGDTGHMVLTSEEPRLLFDANLPQLIRFGMYAEPLAFPIASSDPPEREWKVSRGDLELLYLPDDNRALWSTYEEGLIDFADKAAQLTVLLRKGYRADQLHLGPSPRSHKLA